jgi:two-component system, LytTR family, response regulator LytT
LNARVLLVDDRRENLVALEAILEPLGNEIVSVTSGEAALRELLKNEFALILLDVQMPGLDGFAVLRKLLEKTGAGTLPQIIFATAFDKYAVRAFEVNAVDYLLKPFDRARLEQALARVRARLQNPAQNGHDAPPSTPRTSGLSREQVDSLIRLIEQQGGGAPTNGRSSSRIVVQAGTRMLLVDQKELCFAAIDEGIISVSTPTIEGQSKCRTLEELLELLDPQIFWRAHRSYVVNINHIKEVVPWFKSSYQLRMNDRKNTEIPVSRAQTRRLRELFKL